MVEPQVLLRPYCPPADDPETLRLLEVLRSFTGASWVELALRVEGNNPAKVYASGEVSGSGTAVELPLAGRFSATLRLGLDTPANNDLATLAALAVEKILLTRRLREQVMLLIGALDTTTSSVLLFDSACDIVYANPPADQLLSRQTEGSLVAHQSGQPTQPLFTFLCSMVETVSGSAKAPASWRGNLSLSDGSALACEVIRVTLQGVEEHSGVLVHLQVIDAQPHPFLTDFSLDYRLSPREQEVMRLLVEGSSSAAIAERLGISPHTVRDHVKHLYRKTGTTSRSELLSMFSRAKPGRNG